MQVIYDKYHSDGVYTAAEAIAYERLTNDVSKAIAVHVGLDVFQEAQAGVNVPGYSATPLVFEKFAFDPGPDAPPADPGGGGGGGGNDEGDPWNTYPSLTELADSDVELMEIVSAAAFSDGPGDPISNGAGGVQELPLIEFHIA